MILYVWPVHFLWCYNCVQCCQIVAWPFNSFFPYSSKPRVRPHRKACQDLMTVHAKARFHNLSAFPLGHDACSSSCLFPKQIWSIFHSCSIFKSSELGLVFSSGFGDHEAKDRLQIQLAYCHLRSISPLCFPECNSDWAKLDAYKVQFTKIMLIVAQ